MNSISKSKKRRAEACSPEIFSSSRDRALSIACWAVDEDGSEGDASEHERELGRGLVRLHRVLTGAEGDRGRGLDERARTGADAGDRRFVGAVTSHPRSAFQRGIGGSDAIIVSGGCTSEYSY